MINVIYEPRTPSEYLRLVPKEAPSALVADPECRRGRFASPES
jgi:hypothetical protein